MAGQLIIITGPSGVGKGSILRELLSRHSDIVMSVSVTTRQMRAGEVEGRDYFFVTVERFQQMIAADELLEWAQFVGNYYGTPRHYVSQQLSRRRHVILEIELEGAKQIKQKLPGARFIFVQAPSIDDLRVRLERRNSETPDSIARRLDRAAEELEYVRTHDLFDLILSNRDGEIDACVSELERFIGL